MKRLYRFVFGSALILCLSATHNTPISAQATAELPVLITSIGQSPGPVYFRVFMNRLGYDFVFNSLATVEDMAAGHEEGGPFKTIIIVTGASGKGMGALKNSRLLRCVMFLKSILLSFPWIASTV